MAEDQATRQEAERAKGTPRQVLLAAQEIFELNLEIDVVRSGILDRYRKVVDAQQPAAVDQKRSTPAPWFFESRTAKPPAIRMISTQSGPLPLL
jgi:hypothetical protein